MPQSSVWAGKKVYTGTGEMTQWLQSSGCSSRRSTLYSQRPHGDKQPLCTSSSRGSSALFWTLWAPGTMWHTDTHANKTPICMRIKNCLKKKEDAINKSECPQLPHTIKKRPGPKVDNGEKSRVWDSRFDKVPGGLGIRKTSGKTIQGEGTVGTKAPQLSSDLGPIMPTGKSSIRGLRRWCTGYQMWTLVP